MDQKFKTEFSIRPQVPTGTKKEHHPLAHENGGGQQIMFLLLWSSLVRVLGGVSGLVRELDFRRGTKKEHDLGQLFRAYRDGVLNYAGYVRSDSKSEWLR